MKALCICSVNPTANDSEQQKHKDASISILFCLGFWTYTQLCSFQCPAATKKDVTLLNKLCPPYKHIDSLWPSIPALEADSHQQAISSPNIRGSDLFRASLMRTVITISNQKIILQSQEKHQQNPPFPSSLYVFTYYYFSPTYFHHIPPLSLLTAHILYCKLKWKQGEIQVIR